MIRLGNGFPTSAMGYDCWKLAKQYQIYYEQYIWLIYKSNILGKKLPVSNRPIIVVNSKMYIKEKTMIRVNILLRVKVSEISI